jgi:hypothetical protein
MSRGKNQLWTSTPCGDVSRALVRFLGGVKNDSVLCDLGNAEVLTVLCATLEVLERHDKLTSVGTSGNAVVSRTFFSAKCCSCAWPGRELFSLRFRGTT